MKGRAILFPGPSLPLFLPGEENKGMGCGTKDGDGKAPKWKRGKHVGFLKNI